MAVVEIAYTNFSDNESGLSVRNKINNLGASVSANSIELVAKLSQLDDSVTDIENDISEIQEQLTVLDMVSVGCATALSTQILSPDTITDLTFFNSVFAKSGTGIAESIPNQQIILSKTSTYRVGGSISFFADNNDVVVMELYKNSIPTGFKASGTGRGSAKVSDSCFYGIIPFSENDVLEIRVISTGTYITIDAASMSIEETSY